MGAELQNLQVKFVCQSNSVKVTGARKRDMSSHYTCFCDRQDAFSLAVSIGKSVSVI